MKKETFGPLYAQASTGKIKKWEILIVEDDIVTMSTIAGYVDGKATTSNPKEIKGKNIGKANETTPWEQAVSEAQSKMTKKQDEGYVENIDDVGKEELVLPMLAHTYAKRKHDIEWPAYVQPKLNGVRCIARMTEDDPEYISRKGKQYTTLDHLNKEVEQLICEIGHPLDGEIFNPDWTFQEIIRAVKKDRGEKTDKLQYWIYDVVDINHTFEERISILSDEFILKKGYFKPGELIQIENIVLVQTVLVNSEEEMMQLHKKWINEGFEGTIVRNKKGKYILKNRSKDLQKYKDFLDDEFLIVGGEEATGNDAGTIVFTCRSKAPIGLFEDPKTFKVRPKGSRETRTRWLQDKENIIGKYLTVRYQELSEEGTPIFPVGLAIRDYE
jgi:DNA ligase-1